jgi:hypothetical protein
MMRPRSRAVLLVHGYNVNESEALGVLGRFKNTLGYYAPALLPDIFICSWSGNWNVPVLRPLAYPFMLHNAHESAEPFWKAIRVWYDLPGAPNELVILAHSLGCRLTLEMLKLMHAQGRPLNLSRLVVILMAAAVPVQHIEDEGRLNSALGLADTTVVLHSEDDNILASFFGLGQTIAGDGWFPEAVGLRGAPQPGSWTRSERMQAFDHGDYWAELDTAALIATVLGFSARRHDAGIPLAARKLLRGHRLVEAPLLLSYSSA